MPSTTASLERGLLAGLAGGLAGALAKALAEVLYPPRVAGETAPPVVLARTVAGGPLAEDRERAAKTGIHYAFGGLIGAIYGALVEAVPAVASAEGVAFGLTLDLAAHDGVLPLLGLAEPPQRQRPREATSEAMTHLVFGWVAETVRRAVRARL